MQNVKPLCAFVFFFALACERIFIKRHSIESRCLIGPENILFQGASVLISARKIYGGWGGGGGGAVKGLKKLDALGSMQNVL